MQTFLTNFNHSDTAQELDMKRLGKQRVEILQILNSLLGIKTGWKNHPAVKMWSGHELELVRYGIAICDEWIARGYKDTCREKICNLGLLVASDTGQPPWMTDKELYSQIIISHRSNLIRKDSVHYSPKWPDIPSNLEYIWPTNNKR